MPFPESKRVTYGVNALEEVVCQVRFPTILRILAEPPVAFQERIRAMFPVYSRTDQQLQLANAALQGLPPVFIATGAHGFQSADGVWRLTLTNDFLALTTCAYKDWTDFKNRFAEAARALIELYAPAFYQRIGLRYRDRIDRKKLGFGDAPWSELLKGPVLGELADPDVGPHVEHMLRELIVHIPDDLGRVRMVHGLDGEGQDRTYVIDADFFVEGQTEPARALEILDAFNKRAGHLFRWCTSPKLQAAMQPLEP